MRGRREGWDRDWQNSGRGSEWTVRQEVFKDEDGKARVGLKDGRMEGLSSIWQKLRMLIAFSGYGLRYCIVREAREILLHGNLDLSPARATRINGIIMTVGEKVATATERPQ